LTNVTPKGLEECLINAIEVSPHDPATAYIATTRYKFNDYTPGIYKTTNYGKSWTNISTGIPTGAFTRVVREDNKRKDLLFAGTETGMYISWSGGETWQLFQLNLPVVPITDLKVAHDNLVVATAGRSFWILDDLALLRQRNNDEAAFGLYKPAQSTLGNWGSELNGNASEFDGTNPLRGVNPANGVVIYYRLPALADSAVLSLEIKNAAGQVVRSFKAQKDNTFMSYPGGPPAPTLLPKKKGLNRFVWDMRYPTMTGAPTAYIEGGFRGYKVSPGKYSLTLKTDKQEASTDFEILPNSLYGITAGEYAVYDSFMKTMANSFNEMHGMVNSMLNMQKQISSLLKELSEDEAYAGVRQEGAKLVEKMKAWDEDMIQRKSKSYDDVENFPNKFTAEYIFLINQTESSIPRVINSSRERFEQLSEQWNPLRASAKEIMDVDVPAYNKRLWEAGVGAINVK